MIIINGEEAYPVKNFPHYFITKTGDLYSMFVKGAHGKTDYSNPRKMAYGQDRDGYYRVVLSTNTKHNYKKIHNLMADTFLNHTPDDGLVVNHKDLNKHNNNLDNLELITNGDNIRHYHHNVPDAIPACSKPVIVKNIATSSIIEYRNIHTASCILPLKKCTIRKIILHPEIVIWRYIIIVKTSTTIQAIYNGKIIYEANNIKELAVKLNKSYHDVLYKLNNPKYLFLINHTLSLKSASTIEQVSAPAESN